MFARAPSLKTGHVQPSVPLCKASVPTSQITLSFHRCSPKPLTLTFLSPNPILIHSFGKLLLSAPWLPGFMLFSEKVVMSS